MPVVDHHQHGLAVGCFYQVFQCVQLAVVDHADVVELIIDRAVSKLEQLSGQRRGVEGEDVPVRIGQEHVPLHPAVQLFLSCGQPDLHHIVHPLRHPEVIRRPHGYADIADAPVDGFFRAGLELAPVGRPAVGGVKVQVQIAAHRPAQPRAPIQQIDLGPEVLQPVGRGRAGQSHHAGKPGQHFLERQKTLGAAVLEG